MVIRQHQCRYTDFRRGQRLGAIDHIVNCPRLQRPAWMDAATYATVPEMLGMREVRVGGWVLVTTLVDAKEVSKLELLELYRARWQIELDLRSIKTVMQGMLYKIVSFLIWFHLQGKLPSKQVPNMKDIIPDHAARRHWRAHLASLPLLLAGAMWPMPCVYAADCALLLSGVLLLVNLYRAWKLYLRVMAKVPIESAG